MIKRIIILCSYCLGSVFVNAQTDTLQKTQSNTYQGITFEVQEGYKIKLSFLSQAWMRFSETNSGSTVFGTEKKEIWDVGLRRTRLVLSGDISERVYTFVQLGVNNFSYLGARTPGLFFHDVVGSYKVAEELKIGMGLNSWGGFSRYSAASVGSLLGLDAPLIAQATNNVSDQMSRKLSVFIDGELGQFHYRLAVSKPLSIEQSGQDTTLSQYSSFNVGNAYPQIHGYFKYDVLEKESHKNPYYKGTYLGTKKVLNFGVGFLHQTEAMHRLNNDLVEVKSSMSLFSADAFLELPLKEEGLFSAYFAYFHYNLGQEYLRNIGAMNPANGNNNAAIVNGAGTAFPMIGNGNSIYFQTGYMIPITLGKQTKSMPYFSTQISDYDRLNGLMTYFDGGINVLLNGQRTKLTLAYQNRPEYIYNSNGLGDLNKRRGAYIAQFQFSI